MPLKCYVEKKTSINFEGKTSLLAMLLLKTKCVISLSIFNQSNNYQQVKTKIRVASPDQNTVEFIWISFFVCFNRS